MSEEASRNLTAIPEEEEARVQGRKVIAVIGIDAYQHLQTLHNAVSDARGIRELFTQHLGFEELTPPLYDAQATQTAINALVKDELNSLLAPEDSLVLFFAGHGHTETGQVGQNRKVTTGYLIPIEGQRPEARKFSSYLRLDDFLNSVANLPARHVLLILDACYSGFALGEGIEVMRGDERFSEDLIKRTSRRVITSAMADQPALDSGPVAGHSLFTGSIIEALGHGKADSVRKGFVTASELFLYVQKQVGTWPNSKQTPDYGAFHLDERGELVISLLGKAQSRHLAEESLQIGHAVYTLGCYTNETKRFHVAADHYREARKHAQLSNLALPAAELGLGKALFAVNQPEAAIETLSELIQQEPAQAPVDAYLYLGLAYAQRRDYQPAIKHLQSWRDKTPNHAEGAWIADYQQWLQRRAQPASGGHWALLIGIDHYQLETLPTLRGCVNDVTKLFLPMLTQRFALPRENILLVTDPETKLAQPPDFIATRAGVLQAFATLQQKLTRADSVLIHYSGHSIPSTKPDMVGNAEPDLYWLLHDTVLQDGQISNGLTIRELHQLLKALPVQHKTLILDTHGNDKLTKLAEADGDYNLLLASDTAEVAYEWQIEQNGKKIHCGMLSGALTKALESIPDRQTLTYDRWVNAAIRLTQDASKQSPARQTPLFIGARHDVVFDIIDPYHNAFAFAQRQRWDEYTAEQLQRTYQRWQQQMQVRSPRLESAFARAFQSKGLYQQAQMALTTLLAADVTPNPSLLCPLATAAIYTGKLQQAAASLQQYLALPSTARDDGWYALVDHLATPTDLCRQVIVFLQNIATPLSPTLAAECEQLQQVLQQKFGADGYTFELVSEKKATDKKIAEKIEQLVQQPALQPTLLIILRAKGKKRLDEATDQRIEQYKLLMQGKPIWLWLQTVATAIG